MNHRLPQGADHFSGSPGDILHLIRDSDAMSRSTPPAVTL
jgi:hypothetical protein